MKYVHSGDLVSAKDYNRLVEDFNKRRLRSGHCNQMTQLPVKIKNCSGSAVRSGDILFVSDWLFPDLSAEEQWKRSRDSGVLVVGSRGGSSCTAVLTEMIKPNKIGRAILNNVFTGFVVLGESGNFSKFARVNEHTGVLEYSEDGNIKIIADSSGFCLLKYEQEYFHYTGTLSSEISGPDEEGTVIMSDGEEEKEFLCKAPLLRSDDILEVGVKVIIQRNGLGEWDIIAAQCPADEEEAS